ncbi:hypothetical protein T440DRAFT_513641 [Plenodomus tracheiphilus IPT5]|uniref:SprT-like domain-containing protein n=1 Tax=Plenodomus tracheiphilus IPT5 TaxID=1408161 RepID=A0A6A7BN13_9PLEO|nr:hypothetical protein T440DRAFT_513641 [Plenodomus tracheiphilus IPT5]
MWRDTTNGVIEYFNDLLCVGGSLMDRVTLALTSNPTSEQIVRDDAQSIVGYVDVPRASQIQLCPWFIHWVKSKEYRRQDDVMKRTNFGRMVINLADSVNLLDKVLLHEMTHCRSAYFRNLTLEEEGDSSHSVPLNEDGLLAVDDMDRDIQFGLDDVLVRLSA